MSHLARYIKSATAIGQRTRPERERRAFLWPGEASGASLNLRRRFPPCRPIPLHSLADGFASGSGHLPSRLPTPCCPHHATSASPDDERRRQFVPVERVAEMREQSNEVLGFLYQLAESDFRSPL